MKLAYREYGEGRPLLILHGLFGQSDNWNTLAKQFAETGQRVFTIDQRNHGLSPHSDTWTYNAMAEDLLAFIQDHQLSKPTIIGHSMGGKTLMYFEGLFPDIANKIIICDIAPKVYPPHHVKVLEALRAVDFSKISTRKEAEEILALYLSDFGTRQFLLKNIYWKDAEHNRMDWRFNLEVIDKNYQNISVAVPEYTSTNPCLVIKGEKSDYITKDDEQDFARRYPHIKLASIAGAGHWVHAEKPTDFYNAVMEFIT